MRVRTTIASMSMPQLFATVQSAFSIEYWTNILCDVQQNVVRYMHTKKTAKEQAAMRFFDDTNAFRPDYEPPRGCSQIHILNIFILVSNVWISYHENKKQLLQLALDGWVFVHCSRPWTGWWRRLCETHIHVQIHESLVVELDVGIWGFCLDHTEISRR